MAQTETVHITPIITSFSIIFCTNESMFIGDDLL